MPSILRPRPVRAEIRFLRGLKRLLSLALRIALVGFSLGFLPPSRVVQFLRHDDATVQVEEEEAP